MQCVYCSQVLPQGAPFCTRCGAAVSTTDSAAANTLRQLLAGAMDDSRLQLPQYGEIPATPMHRTRIQRQVLVLSAFQLAFIGIPALALLLTGKSVLCLIPWAIMCGVIWVLVMRNIMRDLRSPVMLEERHDIVEFDFRILRPGDTFNRARVRRRQTIRHAITTTGQRLDVTQAVASELQPGRRYAFVYSPHARILLDIYPV